MVLRHDDSTINIVVELIIIIIIIIIIFSAHFRVERIQPTKHASLFPSALKSSRVKSAIRGVLSRLENIKIVFDRGFAA